MKWWSVQSCRDTPSWLERKLDYRNIGDHLKVNAMLGVPYDEEMIAKAKADVLAQLDEDSDDYEAFAARYPKAPVGNFDGDAKRRDGDGCVDRLSPDAWHSG